MREHCYRGYQMLRKIPFLLEAAEIVYAHQEKFDGSGYPRGLKGEAIPWVGRLVAVVDAFEAMTTTQFRAINANDKKFCQKIQNNDTLNLCMAKVEHKVTYCNRITTDKIKKRCLSYF